MPGLRGTAPAFIRTGVRFAISVLRDTLVNLPFHPLGGSAVDVPMMMETAPFGYAQGDGYQAVDVPYAGQALSLTILLPDSGRFREFADSLDAARVTRVVGDLRDELVALALPKFAYESQFQLAAALQLLGMRDAFNPLTSDFSGMDGQTCPPVDDLCLSLQEVIHKAFIVVDEEGTEAAAATAVVVTDSLATSSNPPQPIPVIVDRPFLFVIRDRATATLLFVGRVMDPRQ